MYHFVLWSISLHTQLGKSVEEIVRVAHYFKLIKNLKMQLTNKMGPRRHTMKRLATETVSPLYVWSREVSLQ